MSSYLLSGCFVVATHLLAIRTNTVNLLTCFKFNILLVVCQYVFWIILWSIRALLILPKRSNYIELYQVQCPLDVSYITLYFYKCQVLILIFFKFLCKNVFLLYNAKIKLLAHWIDSYSIYLYSYMYTMYYCYNSKNIDNIV